MVDLHMCVITCTRHSCMIVSSLSFGIHALFCCCTLSPLFIFFCLICIFGNEKVKIALEKGQARTFYEKAAHFAIAKSDLQIQSEPLGMKLVCELPLHLSNITLLYQRILWINADLSGPDVFSKDLSGVLFLCSTITCRLHFFPNFSRLHSGSYG